jgi:hypothetical protein
MSLTRGDNVCGACGENFASVTLFDWHRTGRHDRLADALFVDGRRCRTRAEFEERGLAVNERGRWHDPVATEAIRARMAENARASVQEPLAA